MKSVCHYSNLVLNFFKLTVIMKAAMPVRTANSLKAKEMGNPSIINFLTAAIYHRAGMMQENHCNICGMFSTGYIIPESNMTGIINPMPEANMAATCVSTIVDISKPNASATKININDNVFNHRRLPEMGTPNTNTASSKMVVRFTHEMTK